MNRSNPTALGAVGGETVLLRAAFSGKPQQFGFVGPAQRVADDDYVKPAYFAK